MSEKIKGSDGIERTIEEWTDFVLERFQLHSSPKKESVPRMQTLIAIQHAFNETHPLKEGKGPDLTSMSINLAVERMSSFFRATLVEALQTKGSPSTRWQMLETTMESFARQCRRQSDNTEDDRVGQICLLIYEQLRTNKEMITSRKELLELARGGKCWAESINPRDISRALEWCKLEDICRDNSKG